MVFLLSAFVFIGLLFLNEAFNTKMHRSTNTPQDLNDKRKFSHVQIKQSPTKNKVESTRGQKHSCIDGLTTQTTSKPTRIGLSRGNFDHNVNRTAQPSHNYHDHYVTVSDFSHHRINRPNNRSVDNIVMPSHSPPHRPSGSKDHQKNPVPATSSKRLTPSRIPSNQKPSIVTKTPTRPSTQGIFGSVSIEHNHKDEYSHGSSSKIDVSPMFAVKRSLALHANPEAYFDIQPTASRNRPLRQDKNLASVAKRLFLVLDQVFRAHRKSSVMNIFFAMKKRKIKGFHLIDYRLRVQQFFSYYLMRFFRKADLTRGFKAIMNGLDCSFRSIIPSTREFSPNPIESIYITILTFPLQKRINRYHFMSCFLLYSSQKMQKRRMKVGLKALSNLYEATKHVEKDFEMFECVLYRIFVTRRMFGFCSIQEAAKRRKIERLAEGFGIILSLVALRCIKPRLEFWRNTTSQISMPTSKDSIRTTSSHNKALSIRANWLIVHIHEVFLRLSRTRKALAFNHIKSIPKSHSIRSSLRSSHNKEHQRKVANNVEQKSAPLKFNHSQHNSSKPIHQRAGPLAPVHARSNLDDSPTISASRIQISTPIQSSHTTFYPANTNNNPDDTFELAERQALLSTIGIDAIFRPENKQNLSTSLEMERNPSFVMKLRTDYSPLSVAQSPLLQSQNRMNVFQLIPNLAAEHQVENLLDSPIKQGSAISQIFEPQKKDSTAKKSTSKSPSPAKPVLAKDPVQPPVPPTSNITSPQMNFFDRAATRNITSVNTGIFDRRESYGQKSQTSPRPNKSDDALLNFGEEYSSISPENDIWATEGNSMGGNLASGRFYASGGQQARVLESECPKKLKIKLTPELVEQINLLYSQSQTAQNGRLPEEIEVFAEVLGEGNKVLPRRGYQQPKENSEAQMDFGTISPIRKLPKPSEVTTEVGVSPPVNSIKSSARSQHSNTQEQSDQKQFTPASNKKFPTQHQAVEPPKKDNSAKISMMPVPLGQEASVHSGLSSSVDTSSFIDHKEGEKDKTVKYIAFANRVPVAEKQIKEELKEDSLSSSDVAIQKTMSFAKGAEIGKKDSPEEERKLKGFSLDDDFLACDLEKSSSHVSHKPKPLVQEESSNATPVGSPTIRPQIIILGTKTDSEIQADIDQKTKINNITLSQVSGIANSNMSINTSMSNNCQEVGNTPSFPNTPSYPASEHHGMKSIIHGR